MRPLFSARDADALFRLRYGKGGRPARRGDRPAAKPKPPRPAAGLLLRCSDFEGDWYLLGLRAEVLGGTWSNIGGSLHSGEHPLVGALREFDEELSVPAAELVGGRIAQVIDCGTDRVPYTLFVVDVPRRFDDAVLGWENDDLYWFHESEVPTLDLHAGFARAWAQVTPTPSKEHV
jgi:8-oxo-dGTP diphosphatase